MMGRILFLTVLLSVSPVSSPEHARIRVRSNLADSLGITVTNASDQPLELVTEIIKQTYCDGPDPELASLRLLLRLSFTNIGKQRLILERGTKSVPVIRISKTAEDAIAKRFESTINNYIIPADSKAQRVGKNPPLGRFAILAPGQSYNTITEVDVSVPRANPVPSIINPGTHYLQIGVWTWDGTQRDAKVKRRAWQAAGFLWSESVFSKPMSFSVTYQPKPADCRCENAKIRESDAIDIARKRFQALSHATTSYKSDAVPQGCVWQVVFEPTTKHAEKPSFIFIIDRDTGTVLGEFH